MVYRIIDNTAFQQFLYCYLYISTIKEEAEAYPHFYIHLNVQSLTLDKRRSSLRLKHDYHAPANV